MQPGWGQREITHTEQGGEKKKKTPQKPPPPNNPPSPKKPGWENPRLVRTARAKGKCLAGCLDIDIRTNNRGKKKRASAPRLAHAMVPSGREYTTLAQVLSPYGVRHRSRLRGRSKVLR